MPFVEYLVESFVLGLADGPTEVHKVTLAAQLLKGYQPAPDLFPSEHLLRRRAEAEAKVADRLAGDPARADGAPSSGEQERVPVRAGAGSDRGHRLDLGVGLGTAAVVLHDQRPRGGRLEARQRPEPLDVGQVAAERVGVDVRAIRRATAARPAYRGLPLVRRRDPRSRGTTRGRHADRRPSRSPSR